MANMVLAYICSWPIVVMARIVMAHIVMAHIVMACNVMAYIACNIMVYMAYIVMARPFAYKAEHAWPETRQEACLLRCPKLTGHTYIGHNYVGHNYIGHNYMGHNYMGLRAAMSQTDARPCRSRRKRRARRSSSERRHAARLPRSPLWHLERVGRIA